MSGQKILGEQAEALFNSGNYYNALELYEKYNKTNKKVNMMYHKGICEYMIGLPKKSIETLSKVIDKDNKNYPKALYYIGLNHIDLGQYKLGGDALKTYLNANQNELTDHQILNIKNILRQCEMGQKIKYAPEMAYVENMGATVNTRYDEITPTQSPSNPDRFYFSSNRDLAKGGRRDSNGNPNDFLGSYCFDMFAVELSNGIWNTIMPFTEAQNSNNHEIVQDFSSDGEVVTFYTGEKLTAGMIHTDTLNDDQKSAVLLAPIYPEIGDKDVQLFKSNILIFASKREGGFGGYDLYYTVQDSMGAWSDPVNFGPQINSVFDEVSPYLCKGGTKMLFSSNRIESIGGYDIFFSDFTNDWASPTNCGPSINSTKDDLDIYVSADGTQALMSSNRLNGEGGFDIYLIYWKDQIIDQISYTEEIPTPYVVKVEETTTMPDRPLPEKNINKVELFLSPLYYNPSEDVLNPSNIVTLKNLSDFNKVYPGGNLKLICHTGRDNLKEFNLFFGLKRSETIKEHLLNLGFKKNQIQIISAGDQYPMLKEFGSPQAQKYHNRIDINYSIDSTKYSIKYQLPEVGEELLNESFESYLQALQGLVYRIYIGKSTQMLRGDVFKKENPFLAILDNDSYQYYFGHFDSYADAKNFKNTLLQQGIVEQADITPFADFDIIEDAESHLIKYSDLTNFIQYGK